MTTLDEDVLALAEAMAGPGQPEPLLKALDAAISGAVGHRLMTVLRITPDGSHMRRIYTNDPVAYPVGGTKPVSVTRWTEIVIRQRRPFLGQSAEIRETLADHELIASLGLGSIINLPVIFDARTLGAVNILERDGFYGPEHLERVRPYALFALPAVLAEPS